MGYIFLCNPLYSTNPRKIAYLCLIIAFISSKVKETCGAHIPRPSWSGGRRGPDEYMQYEANGMKTVFIDGSAGTTGLRIYDRLSQRQDLKLHVLPEAQRKDPEARRDALNSCDVAFLCLPDAAAMEATDMVENPAVVVLDTSTAHRTAPGWVYGFPELSVERAEAVCHSRRIAVPGCHASGFIALVYPLVAEKLLPPDALLTCHSLTGYSGGGKKMIAAYEAPDRSPLYDAPRQYALGQTHKHLKEMKAVCGLEHAPIFCPIVADYYSGMEVTVPLFASQLAPGVTPQQLAELYRRRYSGGMVRYAGGPDDDGLLSAGALSGKDSMELLVSGNEERILLTARYDNLGKGASGAAIACMNLALGLPMSAGLEL